jgi:hypothetical protein
LRSLVTLRFRLLLVALLGTGISARAADALEAARAQVATAQAEADLLQAAQQAPREELAALGRRIERLKAAPGRLLPGGELDASLKRSQELSLALTELARRLTERTAAAEAARLALLDGLGRALTEEREAFERQPAREVRVAGIARMRALRAEREAVRTRLPGARLPAVGALRASDDPEELLAQAEQLRDGQERAQRELQVVVVRLAERRQEAELDRRVQRFLGEESMFDDRDRRLRVQRGGDRSVSLSGGMQPGGTAGPGTGLAGGAGVPAAAAPDSAPSPGTPQVVSAVDARPEPGAGTELAFGDDGVAALEKQREALERLARELGGRASELERRASQL